MPPSNYKELISRRKKVVALLSRYQLEQLSGYERPHLCDINTLRTAVILNWPRERIEDMVRSYLSNCWG